MLNLKFDNHLCLTLHSTCKKWTNCKERFYFWGNLDLRFIKAYHQTVSGR